MRLGTLVRTGIAACFAAVLLTACGGISLSTSETARIYDLSPKSTFDEGLPAVPFQLVIEEPIAARAIDTDRIAVRRSEYEVGYFSGVRWSDRATRMIQTRLVESFENSGKIVSVGRQAIGLRSDYNLKTELREFQVQTPQAPGEPTTVVVALNAKLIAQPATVIVASRTFKRELEVPSEKFIDAVEVFDQALGRVMKRLVQWTLVEMDRDARDGRSQMQRREDMMKSGGALSIDLDDEDEAAGDL